MPQPAPDSRARIVEALWGQPGLSRIELAEELAMDKSTMSRQVGRLIDHGLLRETEARESGPQGGRRRMGLEVNGAWGAWLGLELQPDSCRGVLVDLAGDSVDGFLFDAEVSDTTLEDILERAAAEAHRCSDEAGVPLRAAVLAVPGPVRPGTGIVERSRPLGIAAPADLAERGRSVLNLPTSVSNDTDCGCRAEMNFTPRGAAGNFLYLLAEARRSGLSLGMGTVIGGVLHRGDHGASGEVFSVYRSGGEDQLALDARRLRRAGTDPDALAAVAGELAPQVAMLANVLDIDRLVLGGLFRSHFDAIAPCFAEALEKRRTYPDLAENEVLPAYRGEDAVAYGAAVRFTEELPTQDFWRTL